MKNERVKQAYEAAITDISNLIGWLECELEKTPEKIDWSHVGSLQKVKDELICTLAFYSGTEIQMLREVVEDARLY